MQRAYLYYCKNAISSFIEAKRCLHGEKETVPSMNDMGGYK